MRRDDPARSQVGLRRKASLLFSVIVFFALVVGALFGDGGILHVWKEQERTAELLRELDALRLENALLAEEIAALRTDPRAIERVAREELGLVGPNEVVFLVRGQDSPDHP
jgi:cell division protein FtsB